MDAAANSGLTMKLSTAYPTVSTAYCAAGVDCATDSRMYSSSRAARASSGIDARFSYPSDSMSHTRATESGAYGARLIAALTPNAVDPRSASSATSDTLATFCGAAHARCAETTTSCPPMRNRSVTGPDPPSSVSSAARSFTAPASTMNPSYPGAASAAARFISASTDRNPIARSPGISPPRNASALACSSATDSGIPAGLAAVICAPAGPPDSCPAIVILNAPPASPSCSATCAASANWNPSEAAFGKTSPSISIRSTTRPLSGAPGAATACTVPFTRPSRLVSSFELSMSAARSSPNWAATIAHWAATNRPSGFPSRSADARASGVPGYRSGRPAASFPSSFASKRTRYSDPRTPGLTGTRTSPASGFACRAKATASRALADASMSATTTVRSPYLASSILASGSCPARRFFDARSPGNLDRSRGTIRGGIWSVRCCDPSERIDDCPASRNTKSRSTGATWAPLGTYP